MSTSHPEDDSGVLSIHCPCCQTELTVDQQTGRVLEHAEPERPKADLDQLFAVEKNSRERAERRFEQERQLLSQQDRILEKKFERALRRAQDEPDDAPPPSPFDLD